MWYITRTVDATAEPVTTSEMKTHLRVDSASEDTYIDTLITAARQRFEDDTSRALITQTWRLSADRFPSGDGSITLPRSPLISVSSIQYYDTSNVSQTMSSSLYQVDTNQEHGRVVPVDAEVWPNTYTRHSAVNITFTAGYGASAGYVPTIIKHAIKILVGHWYLSREPIATGISITSIPMSYESLVYQLKIRDLLGNSSMEMM